MPKALTDAEKQQIKADLKQNALTCLGLYGIKKTTVDELVKRANIPKGTFYLLYPSKEVCLFDAINDVHDDIQKKIAADLANLQGNLTAKGLTEIIYNYMVYFDSLNLAKMLFSGEFDILVRKLPPEIISEHFEKDHSFLEDIAKITPKPVPEAELPAFEGALRGVFMLLLHKKEIGKNHFYSTIKLLIYSLVKQLF